MAPVVCTSSRSRTWRGGASAAQIRGGRDIRSALLRPTWGGALARRSGARIGSPLSAASRTAISSAGSKPRRRDREGAAGTATRAPQSNPPGARLAIRSAIGSAAARRRRNFSAATSSRATPSCGTAAQLESRPLIETRAGAGRDSRADAQARHSGFETGADAGHTTQRGGTSIERRSGRKARAATWAVRRYEGRAIRAETVDLSGIVGADCLLGGICPPMRDKCHPNDPVQPARADRQRPPV